MKPQRGESRRMNTRKLLEEYDVEYLKKELIEEKALAEELGLSLQDLLLFRTFLTVDEILDKLDNLSVTAYEPPRW